MNNSAAWSRYAKALTKNVTDLECGSSVTVEYEEWSSWIDPRGFILEYEEWSTWFDILTRDIIAVLGILANAIIIMILNQGHENNTFNKLLVALAFFDTFTLIMFLSVTICKSLKVFQVMFPYFIWPLINIAARGSVFMTVVIAYERYKAVCHPLSFNIGQRSRAVRYVSLVMVLDSILSLPKFFDFEPDDCNGIKFTEMYKNKVYSIYNIALFALLPPINISVLIYLYVKNFHDIKESHLTPARLTSQECLGNAI